MRAKANRQEKEDERSNLRTSARTAHRTGGRTIETLTENLMIYVRAQKAVPRNLAESRPAYAAQESFTAMPLATIRVSFTPLSSTGMTPSDS
jgi:hypothetical protein